MPQAALGCAMATAPEAAAGVAVAVPVAVMAVTDAVAAVEAVRIPAPEAVMGVRDVAADALVAVVVGLVVPAVRDVALRAVTDVPGVPVPVVLDAQQPVATEWSVDYG